MSQEELEDQSLEGFTDIFWIISDFGFLEPKSVKFFQQPEWAISKGCTGR